MPELKRLACPNCGANITDDGSDGVFSCAYCGEDYVASEAKASPQDQIDSEAIETAEPTTENAPETSSVQFNVGDQVAVNWRGTWYAARILSLKSPGLYRVNYDGWSSKWDEDVPVHNIRPAGTVAVTGSKGGSSWGCIASFIIVAAIIGGVLVSIALCGGNAVEATGPPVTAATPLTPGQLVHAQWSNSWYEAEVREVHADGRVTVHYTSYSDASDEAVPRSRLRLIQAAATTAPAPTGNDGQAVERIPLSPLSGPPPVGTRVLAPWDAQRFFYAVVESFEPSGNVTVQFLDGDRRTIPALSLRQDTIAPGTPVAAKPEGGESFFIGRVRQRNGEMFEVEYGDGTSGWVRADSIFVRAQ